MKIALAVLVLALAGGGYFGWEEHQALQSTRADLASTKASLDKAVADARNAKTEAEAARKAVEDQKAALQQAQTDAEAAKNFLEMEKGHSARLQQELQLAREQVAYMSSRSSASGRIPAGMLPMPVQPQIREIRVAPNSGSIQMRAVGAAAPAQPSAPSQGTARPPQQ